MKKISIIFLVMPLFVLAACNLMPEPEKSYDTVEFMYQRVKPITNPGGNDPDCFMIWRNSNGGPPNLHLTKTGDNEWRAEGILDYNNSQDPYYIWEDDSKTMGAARDIFARIKGQQDWIKLTLIEPNEIILGIDWAVFCIDKNGIYFPE